MTTATLSYYFKKTKNVSIAFPQINWKAIFAVGVVFMAGLLTYYVIQINQMTKGSYLTNNYQKQFNLITDENKSLEIDLARMSFMGQIQEKALAIGFVKAKNIKYIEIQSNSVATIKVQ